MADLHELSLRARNAFYDLSVAPAEVRNSALLASASSLRARSEAIFSANAEDLRNAEEDSLAAPLLPRL